MNDEIGLNVFGWFVGRCFNAVMWRTRKLEICTSNKSQCSRANYALVTVIVLCPKRRRFCLTFACLRFCSGNLLSLNSYDSVNS